MTESGPDQQAGQQWPEGAAWPGQAAWPDAGQAWPQSGQQAAWPDAGQAQPAAPAQATHPQAAPGWPAEPAAQQAWPQQPAQPQAPQQPPAHQNPYAYGPQPQHPGQPTQPSPYADPNQPHPGYEQQHYQQPGYEQQHYQQPGYEQQHYQQPGYEQQHYQQPGYEQQRYQQPGYEQQPGYYQQPGYEETPNWDQQQGEYEESEAFHGFDSGGGYDADFNTGWVGDGLGDPMNPSVDHLHLKKQGRGQSGGWRKMFSMGGQGSRDDLQYRTLVNRINQPITGDYRIAILSLKGGVGKTTTTVGLGSTFASLRGDRVIAVDANPDLGTLGSRVPRQSNSTVRDLLVDTSIYRYSDVRAHTSQSTSRLEVLASERDPAISEAFSERDYRGVIKILQRFYNVILTDCGTGLMHSAMKGVLDLAHALVLVTSPALDGARSAGATLDWLLHHSYDQLVARTVVVVSSSRPGSPTLDLNQLRQHFLVRCRAVQIIPFDDHLSEGAEIELDQLHRSTRRSFVELAALIADDFPMAMSRQQRSQY